MRNIFLSTALAVFLSAPAFAAGSHDDHAMMMVGMPGDADAVDRMIHVVMKTGSDGGMTFEPALIEVAMGETIHFHVMNQSDQEHQFVIDTVEGNAKHKAAMEKMDMEHDDPNSVRLDAGTVGGVYWKFTKMGAFEFACLLPGHYDAGMNGAITVSEKMAHSDSHGASHGSGHGQGAELEYTTGKIKKINDKSGKVTIIHGPLSNLDMPAMTMVFRADEETIAKMSVGQKIEFAADRVKGKLTVIDMK